MRRIWLIAGGVLAALVFLFWFLILDARAPGAAPGVFDIGEYRRLAASGDGALPTEVRIETVGVDLAPSWAVQAGNFAEPVHMAYTAMQIVGPERTIVIGGAIDEATSREMAQTAEADFHHDAYMRVIDAMAEADQVWITHEHLDHVMAIARSPEPETLAPKLRLNEHQLAALPQFARDGALDPAIAGVQPAPFDQPRRIAPGVVVAPMSGHTRGSQVFFVALQDGRELLLVGDIVWSMSNIEDLKTRPRLLQFVVFDPSEARSRVLRQVRGLHDLAVAEPDLVIVPSHDRSYLERLVDQGVLIDGFALLATEQS